MSYWYLKSLRLSIFGFLNLEFLTLMAQPILSTSVLHFLLTNDVSWTDASTFLNDILHIQMHSIAVSQRNQIYVTSNCFWKYLESYPFLLLPRWKPKRPFFTLMAYSNIEIGKAYTKTHTHSLADKLALL